MHPMAPPAAVIAAADLASGDVAIDAPYQRLDELPRGLWLPALVCSAGESARRLADLAPWRAALVAGELPAPALDFADPAPLQALRSAIGEL